MTKFSEMFTKGDFHMKRKRKQLIACVLVLCLSAGGGLLWNHFMLSSHEIANEPTEMVGEEFASVYADTTNLRAILDVHDTVITAQYESSSAPYSMGVEDIPLPDGGTIDMLEWYVDTTYTVQESLRGQLQPGDTVTVQEHLDTETATPYSKTVDATATDCTLLFLIEGEEGEYRLSLPVLSIQPVKQSQAESRQIVWMNGVNRRTLPGTKETVVVGTINEPEEGNENTLNWYGTSAVYVNSMAELYMAVADDSYTVTPLLDKSDAVLSGTIEQVSDAYEEDGCWYRDLTVTPDQVYSAASSSLSGNDPITVQAAVGSSYEEIPTGESHLLLLQEENSTYRLTGSVYDSLCAINEQERIQWFGGPTRANVNEGLRDLSDVEAYCQEKE